MSLPGRPAATPVSGLVLAAALVAVAALATAAVLFVSGDGSLERLGLLLALLGSVIAGLLGMVRADQAAAQTSSTSALVGRLNGDLDVRIINAVRDAMADRRSTDPGAGRSSDPKP